MPDKSWKQRLHFILLKLVPGWIILTTTGTITDDKSVDCLVRDGFEPIVKIYCHLSMVAEKKIKAMH